MVLLGSKRSKKAGLPGGALEYVGPPETQAVKVYLFEYDEKSCSEREITDFSELQRLPDTNMIRWIDVRGVHEMSVLEALGKKFNLHPLLLEDVMNTTKRPKFEEFEDYVFLLLKMIYPNPHGKDFHYEQVSLVFSDRWIISFQEPGEDTFEAVRSRLRLGKGRLRRLNAGFLAYALSDSIVDAYFGVLETYGEAIEALEGAMVANADRDLLLELHKLKRFGISMRRALWPLRESVSTLLRSDNSFVDDPTKVFLRDVYDHVVELIDILEADREILSGILDMYLSGLSNRMNSIMMVLTLVTTIFMPLTFIAGVYGMNFKYMPELEWQYGYAFALALMFGIAVSMGLYFRSKGWLKGISLAKSLDTHKHIPSSM